MPCEHGWNSFILVSTKKAPKGSQFYALKAPKFDANRCHVFPLLSHVSLRNMDETLESALQKAEKKTGTREVTETTGSIDVIHEMYRQNTSTDW